MKKDIRLLTIIAHGASTRTHTLYFVSLTGFVIMLLGLFSPVSGQSHLWQIGKPDRNYHEFALASEGYSRFSDDGFFVVGDSDPLNDWPFVHPGPQDAWAGNHPHTFTILFGIGDGASKIPHDKTDTVCRLIFDLVDVQGITPPLLNILINNQNYIRKLQAGAGDASIHGHPEQGKQVRFAVEFPARLLKKGNNEVKIVNSKGSWFLYDAITLKTPKWIKPAPVHGFIKIANVSVESAVRKTEGQLFQTLHATVKYAGKSQSVALEFMGAKKEKIRLSPGIRHYSMLIPLITQKGKASVRLLNRSRVVASYPVKTEPPKKMTVYILPHSHTDIGYTAVQTEIEAKQVENLRKGIEYARQTAGNPKGARFVWNIEVSWAADLYLNRLGKTDRTKFLEAVKKGWIAINGMYLNELTGLCRPEELLRLFRYSTQLAEETGVPVDAAMISDVPGYTWGTVTALTQAGIKYFSVAPNYFDRIGDIMQQWENKPFYWVSPSGRERVLVWVPYRGYAWSHMIPALNKTTATQFFDELKKANYPYDIAYMRWSGHGDNAVPEPEICDFVKQWNQEYAWPKFIISSTSEAFRAFESKYGNQLKEFRGDWTPYWEDGAGSSAFETAMNRNSADRLTQAEALWALEDPADYPSQTFDEAWEKTLLYSEHTWGAWCSITDPENQLTTDQWIIKKSYADEADRLSRTLICLKQDNQIDQKNVNQIKRKLSNQDIKILNTSAWTRKEPVIIQKTIAEGINRILNEKHHPVPFQRLSTGDIVFVPDSVLPYSATQYHLINQSERNHSNIAAPNLISGNTLSNGLIRADIDPVSGNIISLTAKGIKSNLVDRSTAYSLNQYLFLKGHDLKNLQTTGTSTIRTVENGPLYGVIEVHSEAPGCHTLIRRYVIATGMDYLQIENIVDKKRAPMPTRIGDWNLAQNENKESVNFVFPFAIQHGVMRMDLPIGSIIPWKDQIPGSCKNWFTVGRYIDISNSDYGVTWFTLDAPLVEVGYLSATLVGSQTDPKVWRQEVKPTQTFYSWVMNNHWGTNYRQYQEGRVTFRYAIRPHLNSDAAGTYRIATGMSQPLLVRPVSEKPIDVPFTIEGKEMVVVSLKPADQGNGYIVRLYNPDQFTHQSQLITHGMTIWLSNTAEQKLRRLQPDITLHGMQLVTLRIEPN